MVLRPMGNDFGCTASTFTVERNLSMLRDRIEHAGMSANASRSYGWNVDLEADELWQLVGLREIPIPEYVFQHGKVLDVNGLLLTWFDAAGTTNYRESFNA